MIYVYQSMVCFCRIMSWEPMMKRRKKEVMMTRMASLTACRAVSEKKTNHTALGDDRMR